MTRPSIASKPSLDDAIAAARARLHERIEARLAIGDQRLTRLAQFHRRALAQRFRSDRIALVPRPRVVAWSGPAQLSA